MGREFVLSFWYVDDGTPEQTGAHMSPTLYISTIVNQLVIVNISTPLLSATDQAYVQVRPRVRLYFLMLER